MVVCGVVVCGDLGYLFVVVGVVFCDLGFGCVGCGGCD